MSLSINLSSSKTITLKPAETLEIPSGDLIIERIIDIPDEKKVYVQVDNFLELIELDELSGDNYDTPNEWTNADVKTALTNYINSAS